MGLLLDQWYISLFPIVIVLSYLAISNPKFSFFLFFGILPFSIEIYFPNGLGTDLPTEPIILFFFLYSIFFFIRKKYSSYQLDIVTLFILIHLIWIMFTTIWAHYPMVSAKFLAAKLWYILPFYFLSTHFLKEKKDLSYLVRVFLSGLAISIIYVMVRHFTRDFSFDTIGWAVSPFYRNHVNYAVLLVIALPLCWYKVKISSNKKWYFLFFIILLSAIYFSFTRAAMVAVFVMAVAALLIRYKILFYVSLLSLIIALSGLFYMVHDNNYLHLAPNYESTVAHSRFDNLMEATYKMEDISTMERLHRWVAGLKMINKKPWTGFGPNNFYFTYKPFTSNSFKTYVSDNPDKSGIHNYYLMTAVEQGVIGLLILLSLLLSAIYKGERTYHRVHDSKNTVMMSLLILIGIMVMILINDLIEAVKVGPFLFLSLALISFHSKKSKEILYKGE